MASQIEYRRFSVDLPVSSLDNSVKTLPFVLPSNRSAKLVELSADVKDLTYRYLQTIPILEVTLQDPYYVNPRNRGDRGFVERIGLGMAYAFNETLQVGGMVYTEAKKSWYVNRAPYIPRKGLKLICRTTDTEFVSGTVVLNVNMLIRFDELTDIQQLQEFLGA